MQKLKNLQGLYFRPKDYVAFLYPCKSVHTLFLTKKIDVAFVNKQNKVVKIVKELNP